MGRTDSALDRILEDTALDRILEDEGWPRYTDSPYDRGGPTKGGITLDTLRRWRGERVGTQDLQDLSRSEALEIYRSLYVDRPGFDRIQDPDLRHLVVDCGVLHGPSRATRWLQEAVGATQDGILGPQTLAALRDTDPPAAAVRVCATRQRFLGRLITRDPSQARYALGWARRASGFLDHVADRLCRGT